MDPGPQAKGRVPEADASAATVPLTLPLRPIADNAEGIDAAVRIGPYKLAEEIGRGGMGTVYRALRDDQEFASEVAIKIVNRDSDSTFLLDRLRTERQILAGLEHPNIARLIDGGRTSDGRPYFVMEYVRGSKLTTYCAQQKLSVKQRITLFRSICDAVGYAHQRLVIHRDLKPDNILVTNDGVPKLLDFGIAKLMQEDSGIADPDRTQTLVQMATPAYSSPEQIRGGQVGVGSDIYSLGVVLYELLSGQRPFRLSNKTLEESARIICEREPTRPSVAALTSGDPAAGEVLRRQLTGDLDNIIALALRKEPERRYQSVAHLSEDLQRHLNGLPVLARGDSFAYSASKFVSRHKGGTVLAIASFLLLCCAGLFAGWKAHQLSLRVDEDRKLASTFLMDMHDEIARLPGATPARQALLTKSVEYLNGLAQYGGSDPSMQRSLAVAYERFSELLGGVDGAGLGKSAEALRAYEPSRLLREQLALRVPAPSSRADLSTNYLLGSYLAGRAGMNELRSAYDNKALAIAQELARAEPDNMAYQSLLARAYTGAAYGDSLAGRKVAAMAYYLEALRIRERIQSVQRSAAGARDLANSYYRLGVLQVQTGRAREAMPNLQRALALQTSFPAPESSKLGLPSDIASTHHFLCLALRSTGDSKGALQHCDAAIQIRQPALAADPMDGRNKSLLAGNYAERSTVLSQMNRKADALSSIGKAIELQRELLATDAKGLPTRISLADFEGRMAELDEQAKDWHAASTHWSRAVQLYDGLQHDGKLKASDMVASAREARLGAARSTHMATLQ